MTTIIAESKQPILCPQCKQLKFHFVIVNGARCVTCDEIERWVNIMLGRETI